jgi:HK97 gp10 family phage protein|tara:strand:- start:137 stop:595 length:459 start_codon:yes stop_codon:yes gene_type:complete
MAGRNFNISGAANLEKVLKKLGPKLAERELMKSLRAGANVVRKEVKARAPVGTGSAHAKYGRVKDNVKTTAVKKTIHSGEVAVHTGKAFWAAFYEFGTARQPPRPFMGPAFEATQRQALDRLGTTLGRGVERTAGELAGKYGAIRKSTKKRI